MEYMPGLVFCICQSFSKEIMTCCISFPGSRIEFCSQPPQVKSLKTYYHNMNGVKSFLSSIFVAFHIYRNDVIIVTELIVT